MIFTRSVEFKFGRSKQSGSLHGPVVSVARCPRIKIRACKRRHLNIASCTSDDDVVRGDEAENMNVQDALEEIMMMSVRKEQVKEKILVDLEVKKERLRSIGEELMEEFAQEIELDKMRTELASNRSLAETLQKFQELEDEVQAVRDGLRADRLDMADWEQRNATARNQGLFFGRLHKPSRNEDDPDDSEAYKASPQLLGRIREPATKEVNSPGRLFMFSYLAIVPLIVLVQDLMVDDPSYGLDALYGVISVVMLYNVWGERDALRVVKTDEQEAQAALQAVKAEKHDTQGGA